MRIVLDELISWQYLILLLLFFLFLLWLFFGGTEPVEFVGFNPLAVGKDELGHSLDNLNEPNDSNNSNELNDPVIEISFIDDYNIEPLNHKINQSQENIYNEINQNNNFVDNIDLITQSEDYNLFDKNINENYNEDLFSVMGNTNKKISSPKLNNITHVNNINNGNINCKTSKGEAICKKVLEDLYGQPFITVRPDFLKNPETGRNLELDLYNAKLKLAVEYNGEQHYVFPNCFHKTETEFINQVRRDQYKKQKCSELNIHLINVPYTVPKNYNDIKNFITQRLPVL